MTIIIRDLVDADLPAADAILKLAFRSPVSRLEDLGLYRQIQPDGWFVAAQAEHPVGMVGAANYGACAHIGMMAVHPRAQRQGIGLALMQFILARLEQQQVPGVTLDASAAGRPLYEKLGFIPFDETLIFQRTGEFSLPEQPARLQPITVRELDELVQADTPAFGANRRKVFEVLLRAFPGRAFLRRDDLGRLGGYLFAQSNRIGPWVMLQPEGADALLRAALTLPFAGIVSMAVPEANRAALDLLQRSGFEPVRTNRHMGRGMHTPPGQRQQVYAQTSLAVG